MKKRVLALLLAGIMICAAGCGAAEAGDRSGNRTNGGNPWINSDLKENITENMELSPKDDFHLYANYDWLCQAEIMEGYSAAMSFVDMEAETMEKARAALEDDTIEGHEAELCRHLYEAWLNWDERNALGVEPMMDTVRDIQSISTLEELTEFICDMDRNWGVTIFAGVGNTPGLDDASAYVVYVGADGFLLEDAAEYTERTEYGDRYYEGRKKAVSGMLQRAGYTEEDGDALFDQVIEFEALLAEVSLSSADFMVPDVYDRINNVYTWEELEELCSSFPLTKLLEAAGYREGELFWMEEPDYFRRLDELYTEENLENMKAYMLANWVKSMATSLDQESFELSLECSGIISGAEGRTEDEEYAFDIVKSMLTEPLEQTYLKKYDASKKKEDITRLCENIITVYRDMLEEQEWMSEETKEKAVEKLDSIKIHAVYPEKWYDYSSLSLEGLSYVECQKAISGFDRERNVALTNQNVDRDQWNDNILECNAYYDPQYNSINILLGMLGQNFYGEDMIPEQLYGGIGCIIGHEISHAFDTTGAQFDKDGNLSNWWTEEDMAAFKERTEKLVSYYDTITVFEGQTVSGESVQGEAIADLAGMKCILTMAGEQEDFDYDVMFRQYASTWRTISTYEYEYEILTQDEHPNNYLRTNVTLQQFDEFYETYDVQPGDSMYLAPEDRILVW